MVVFDILNGRYIGEKQFNYEFLEWKTQLKYEKKSMLFMKSSRKTKGFQHISRLKN